MCAGQQTSKQIHSASRDDFVVMLW